MEKLLKKLKEIYSSRDWTKTSADIETLLRPFDDYLSIEYNIPKSGLHPNAKSNG